MNEEMEKEKSSGMFISDLDGKEVEVTDLEKSIEFCKDAILWHETKEGITYPDAKKDFEHKLRQLEQIKRNML